jgi:transcriptional regulator GlxA family with amidase domain
MHPDDYTETALKAARMQCDAEFARCLRTSKTQSDFRLLTDAAVHWMKQNLHQANPVFLLCDYLQVSRTTLDKLFRRSFGESPSAYHHRLRMERAGHLLEKKKQMIKTVAFSIGYKHPSDFSRAYKAFQQQRASTPNR